MCWNVAKGDNPSSYKISSQEYFPLYSVQKPFMSFKILFFIKLTVISKVNLLHVQYLLHYNIFNTRNVSIGHRCPKIDFWTPSLTLTLNFKASKYPGAQDYMLTSINNYQIYGSMTCNFGETCTYHKNFMLETCGQVHTFMPPTKLWGH